MRESKGELTDRLRREGRWEAFMRRREELKANGTDAGDAWRIAAVEFPPPPPLDSTPDGEGGPEIYLALDRAARGKTASDYKNIQWAKNLLRIPLTEIDPESVPSPAAVSMLQWARSNRSKFCEMMIPRAVAPKGEDAHNARNDGDEALLETIAEIARIGFESPTLVGLEGLPENSDDSTGNEAGEMR